jgi:gas vesicle protein
VEDGTQPNRADEPGADLNPAGNAEFVAGFFTGALAGAALAMILTPQSGDDLRHVLRATIRKLSNRTRDLVADMGSPATNGELPDAPTAAVPQETPWTSK